jgi:hypothetical protein
MVTGEFTLLNQYTDEDLEIVYKTGMSDISEIALYRELKEKSKYALNSVFNKSPRKVVNKVVDNTEKEVKPIDNSALDSILGRKKNLPQIPNSNIRPKPQNSVGSNKETLQKLFLQKKMKKSDAPYMNIGGKINK